MSQHVFRVLAYAGMLAAALCVAPGYPATTLAAAEFTPPPTAVTTSGTLVTVAQVVALAAASPPQVAAAAAARAAAVAAVEDTRAWANPTAEVHVGRARYRDGSDRVSVGGIELRQPFTLPGKRNARIDAALAEQQVVARQLDLERIELELRVRAAALDVAEAEATAVVAQQALAVAQELSAAVLRRVAAQDGSTADLARAQVDELSARLAADAALRIADAARAALRSWCGDALPPTFTLVNVWPDVPIALAQPLARAQPVLPVDPRAALFAAERAADNAALERERRAWQPELSAGLTADRGSDTNDLGVVVGIELPLWNRNAAGIARTEAARVGNAARAQAERLTSARAAASAWQTYDNARVSALALATQALPAANTVLALRQHAYAVGEASVIEVIDARRAVSGIASELLHARTTAARAALDLHSVLGVAPTAVPASAAASSLPTLAPVGTQP